MCFWEFDRRYLPIECDYICDAWLKRSVVCRCTVAVMMSDTLTALVPSVSVPGSREIAQFTNEFNVRSAEDILVCRWNRLWGRVSPNAYGTTGWATVVRSQCQSVADGDVLRIACSK